MTDSNAEPIPSGRAGRSAQRPGRAPAPALIYLDEALAVVDKPAGLLTVPGRGRGPTLVDRLALLAPFARRADREALRVVHRLDRDTSGVVVFARTLEAQRALSAQFAAGRVEKVYLALVSGFVPGDGCVDLPIAATGAQRMRIARGGQGRPATTEYRVLERLPGNTLLECRPLTGRTHQVRVHLAAIGHPLTVDPLYGGGQTLMLSHYKGAYRASTRHEERPLIARLTLHAASIAFDHPRDGTRVRFESPLPRDFRATLVQLRKLVRPGPTADGPAPPPGPRPG